MVMVDGSFRSWATPADAPRTAKAATAAKDTGLENRVTLSPPVRRLVLPDASPRKFEDVRAGGPWMDPDAAEQRVGDNTRTSFDQCIVRQTDCVGEPPYLASTAA